MTAISSGSAATTLPLEVRFEASELVFDDRGLLPVVVQEISSGALLMVAWADREAIEQTLATGLGHFWSRSRKELWQKGATSGNRLRVQEVCADCDLDTLLYRAHPEGPTCHLGTRSCFEGQPAGLELGWLAEIIGRRRAEGSNSTSYTRRLLDQGVERVAQKVGEEGVEVVIAALGREQVAEEGEPEGGSRLASESADLLYHLLVLLEACDVGIHEVAEELVARHRSAG